MLQLFYDSGMASAVTSAVVSWCSLRAQDINKINRKASPVVREELDSLDKVPERRMLFKRSKMLNSCFTSSPLLAEHIGAHLATDSD